VTGVLHLARPEILALAPYAHAEWDPALVRLHANENPWRSEADRSRDGLNRYPEPQSSALIQRLACLYGVEPDRVLVGRGSDEGIDLLVRTFCAAGRDRVVVCPPTFAMYRFAADVQGAAVSEVPLDAARGFDLDVTALKAACDPTVKLVFLCSPNNPTGNRFPDDAVREVLDALAGRAIVVVDEAYVEFAEGPSLVDWLAAYPHLVILRTLSKAYGLAGARCGAVLAAADVIGLLRRVIPPYALTVQSIESVLDALHPDRLEAVRARVAAIRAERTRMLEGLARIPLVEQVWPSQANFLLVSSRDAGRLLQAGIRGGLLVRDVRRQPALERCLRITIGSPEQNDRLLESLGAA
jgi:histidinol-phosphate aminotransferase